MLTACSDFHAPRGENDHWDVFAKVPLASALELLRKDMPQDSWVSIKTNESGTGKINIDTSGRLSAGIGFSHKEKVAVIDDVTAHQSGNGLGTQFVGNSLELFSLCGFHRMGVLASLDGGAYTWGRMGGLPDDPHDDGLWPRVTTKYTALRDALHPRVTREMDEVALDRSRMNLWRLVDARHDITPSLAPIFLAASAGVQEAKLKQHRILGPLNHDRFGQVLKNVSEGLPLPIGRYLTQDASWEGGFDLTNRDGSMDRARQYVRERRAHLANHHPANDR